MRVEFSFMHVSLSKEEQQHNCLNNNKHSETIYIGIIFPSSSSLSSSSFFSSTVPPTYHRMTSSQLLCTTPIWNRQHNRRNSFMSWTVPRTRENMPMCRCVGLCMWVLAVVCPWDVAHLQSSCEVQGLVRPQIRDTYSQPTIIKWISKFTRDVVRQEN